jgi:rSAM/selenodomain-associated transferase 2
MLSIVIPTLDAAASLPATLAALADGGDEVVIEIIVADGGSTDATPALAARQGARLVAATPGRGPQLAAGGAAARGDWLLFLHADTRLAPGWRAVAARFMAAPGNRMRAAYFRYALDDDAPAARRLERVVAWRCRRLALPYGDQGLLMSRALYAAVGGYRPIVLMEDVDIVRRLGRTRLAALDHAAVTSAARYRRDGYLRRSLRNLVCLSAWFLGVSPRRIARLYG